MTQAEIMELVEENAKLKRENSMLKDLLEALQNNIEITKGILNKCLVRMKE